MKPNYPDIVAGVLVAVIALVLFHGTISSSAERRQYWDTLRFDEAQYASIVGNGYRQPQSYTDESNLSFAPAWPFVWATAAAVTGSRDNPVGVRSVLAAGLFIFGMIGLALAMRAYSGDPWRARFTLLLIGVWPGSFYFLTGYAEALYFALLGGFFALVSRGRYLMAAGVAAAAITTHTSALILLPALLVRITLAPGGLIASRDGFAEGSVATTVIARPGSPLRVALLATGITLAGLAVHWIVMWLSVGDPLAFVQAYEASVQVREYRSYSLSMQLPIHAWVNLPESDGVRIATVQFLALPVLLILSRRRMPIELTAFAAIGWLSFLFEQSHYQPFVHMLRWLAILFPFQYGVVLMLEKLASLWQREAGVWRAVFCCGVAFVYATFYVRVVLDFITGVRLP